MKTVMVVGGGEWQVPIVRKAKEMGLYVVNTNLYQNSPGFEFSDIGLVADVLDKEKNLYYARHYLVDAVVTDQSDISVPTTAFIAEQLGVAGIGTATAELFTNKYLMREFCVEHDFPSPSFKLCNDFSEVEEFVKTNGYPCVVKPPASQSSRGVVKVATPEDLPGAYFSALEQSHNGLVLIEGFIGGVELTVDGIQLNAGSHICLATSCKTHYERNPMVASQLLFTHVHPEIDYAALHSQHNRMIERMKLPFGLTHAEYKYFQEKFYLIEVAARGGGTRLSSDIVPLMSGVDSTSLLIRMALGEKISKVIPSFADRVCVLDFFQFDAGVIRSIAGLAKAKSLDGVLALSLNINIGEKINPVVDDRSRHGFVIAFADTLRELRLLLREIRQTLEVRYE